MDIIIIIIILVIITIILFTIILSKTSNSIYKLPKNKLFVTDNPKFSDRLSRNIRLISIEGGGMDYVKKCTPEAINKMHIKYYKTIKLVIKMPNINLPKMIQRFIQRPREKYQVQFYREMAPFMIKWKHETNNNEVTNRIIFIESLWETYIYIYIKLSKYLPSSIIETLSSIGCTTAITKGEYTKNGDSYILHNFDWMTTGYENLPLSVINFKQFGITQIGYVGAPFTVIAAINDYGVFTTINNASYSLGFNLNMEISPIATHVFTLLQGATTANEMGTRLYKANFDISCFYSAGDEKGMIIISSNSITNKYDLTQNSDMFVLANKTINQSWGKDVNPRGFGSDSDRRKRNMSILLEKFKGQIDVPLLCHIAQEPLYMNNGQYGPGSTEYNKKHSNQDLTMFQMVYHPLGRTIYLRGKYPFDPNSNWDQIKMNIANE